MVWSAVGSKTFVDGDELPAADLNTYLIDNLEALNPLDTVAATSWTPAIARSSDATTTSAANAGRYYRLGPIVWAWAYWLEPAFAGGANGGTLQLTLPVASSGVTAAAAGGQAIGTWRAHDSSATANSESGAVYLSAGQTVRFGRPVGNVATDSVPVDFSTSDSFSVCLFYPVA